VKTRRTMALAALLLLVGGAMVVGARFLRRTPSGQSPLVTLDGLEPLRQAFSEARGPKLLLLFSPTCPVCRQSASEVQRLLDADVDPTLHVFVVWTKVLRYDRLGPLPSALGTIHDGRANQYFDPRGLTAAALCRNEPQGSRMCAESPLLFGFVGFYPVGVVWTDAIPWPSFAAYDPDAQQLRPWLQ
jgi:hypothetical protein